MKNLYLKLLALLLAAAPVSAQPPGWSYFQTITLTNSGSSLVTNYQMPVIVNTQTLISASQMQSNGNDIRFGASCNSTTFFPHYLDTGINTANTRIWVKIDTLQPSSSRTIYMYYGNSSAASTSTLSIFNGPYSSTNQVTGGTSGGVSNCQRGFRFAPNTDILVTQFGKHEPTGTTRYVTLFDNTTQNILRQMQVTGATTAYTYSNLSSPIWLTSGTQYILQLHSGTGDGYYYGTSSQINSNLTYYDMRYCNSCNQNTFPTNVLSNYHYGYPDFNFYTRNTVTPAPTFAIGGTGGGPQITTQPASITVCSGATTTLSVVASGTSNTYQWQVNTGSGFQNLSNGAPYSGVTTPNLQISNATPGLSGNQYRVVISGSCNTTSTSATATLTVVTSVTPTITITASPGSTVCAGTQVSFSSAITNGGSSPQYVWKKNGAVIAGATGTTYSSSSLATGDIITAELSSAFSCASPATVASNSINMAINVQPPPVLSNAGPVCAGENLSLSAASIPNATYAWSGPNNFASTAQNPTISNAQSAASGTYSATVTVNGCTSAPATTSATVYALPTATASANGPAVICQGDTVQINANTGSGLSYQWLMNNQPIPGATASSLKAPNTGNYSVQVTDGNNCKRTSTAVAVTVNPNPGATINYSTPLSFCDGGAVALTANTAPGISYQWRLNGNPIPGATSSFYVAEQSGVYTVYETNNFNCNGLSNPLQITVHPLPSPPITQNGMTLNTATGFSTYQWYMNNQPIPGATNPSLSVSQNGVYWVVVTDATGCQGRSQQIFFTGVSVPSVHVKQDEVQLYPNPAADVVYIQAPVKVNVFIRSMEGRLVLFEIDARKMDVSALAAGVYLAMITDELGHIIRTERLLVTGRP